MIRIPDSYRVAASLIAVLLLVTTSFAAGYRVSQWHGDAQKLEEAKASEKTLSDRIDKAVADYNTGLQKTIASNGETLKAMVSLNSKLEAQSNAFRKIQIDLKGIDVGNCSFTPANDSLYERAYEAAFGHSDDSVSAASKAASSHAANRAAVEADANKPPVPK